MDQSKAKTLNGLVHLFEKEGRHYAFAIYTNRLWELDIKEAEVLKSILHGKDLDELCHAETSFDIRSFLTDIYEGSFIDVNAVKQEERGLESMVLIISDSCNFSCTYCYGSYGEKHGLMPFEIAKKAIDLAIDAEIFDIVFFGGEPMLNFPLIEQVVAYAESKALYQPFTFRMTTNGALITEENAAYFKEHNFEISVSMDGDRLSHDTTRIFKDGTSSYDKVLNGIEILKKYNVLSLLEITYSARHRIDMKQQLRCALDLYPCVSCACVDGKTDSKHNKDIVSGERLTAFYNQILDFEEKDLKTNEQLLGAKELYNRICDGNYLFHPKRLCSDISSRLVVTSNGNVVPCPEMSEMDAYTICNVQELDDIHTFYKKREVVLDRLSADKIEKKWFSGLCETCIQHVAEENGKFVYTNEKSFSDCIENLLIRFAKRND